MVISEPGYFSAISWAFFSEAMQQIREQYMLPTVASLEPTHCKKAMDWATWPVLGRTTSPLVGPEALSILSICRVVTTSLSLPKPYSSFRAASKGCHPVATIMAPTLIVKCSTT
ncbi:MAG: hypothetical protein A4E43_00579 [Methanosaeta sp. PtaB.Bin005]|nr:MAG: hypothetical protein A4E43_00579 [Methanosaeta sp. PtaB.Bin005]